MRTTAFVAVLMLWCGQADAQARDTDLVIVNVAEARLRERPDAQARIVRSLLFGTVLEVIRREPGWLLVTVPGGSGEVGYVAAETLGVFYGAVPRSVPPADAALPPGEPLRPDAWDDQAAVPLADDETPAGPTNWNRTLGVKAGMAFPTGDLADADLGGGIAVGGDLIMTTMRGFGGYLDVGYHRSGAAESGALGQVNFAAEYSLSAFRISGGPLFRAPTGSIRPYGGIGIAFVSAKASGSASVLGVSLVDFDEGESGLGLDLVMGVQARLSDRLSGLLEVRMSRASVEGGDLSWVIASAGVRF